MIVSLQYAIAIDVRLSLLIMLYASITSQYERVVV